MKNYICIILFLLLCIRAHGQSSTQGKDFWLSFGINSGYTYSSQVTLQVRVVTTKATNVTFTFTETGASATIPLAAGSVYTRDLSAAEKLAVFSNATGSSEKSLHIQSDEDVSVYAINLVQYTTDATGILPVTSLGVSYYHLSYAPVATRNDGYTIVAVEDNTNVYDNGVFVVALNKGDVYSQYFSSGDATGKHITADKPIAYFITNTCVNVSPGIGYCDCLYEQLFPEALWGTQFMVPVTIRAKERIRVLASQDGTIITHIGGTVISGSLN
jgi:hypothetical protein